MGTRGSFTELLLAAGVRQFFHRMVVCLEDDALPFVPTMVNLLLETPDAKELYDFTSMLNQLVTKFKVSERVDNFCFRLLPCRTVLYPSQPLNKPELLVL